MDIIKNDEELIPMDVRVLCPKEASLSRNAALILDFVNQFTVNDVNTFSSAADELKSIKKKASALEDQRKSITAPMDKAKKAVMDLFRNPLNLLCEAERVLKAKMLDYQTEEHRKAEAARIEAERIASEERARIATEAEKLAAEGRAAEAKEKEKSAAMVVAAPTIHKEVPAIKGISTATTIDFEIVDLFALVNHVAQHHELISFITLDTAKIRSYVRGLGMECNLPGVNVFEKQTIVARK